MPTTNLSPLPDFEPSRGALVARSGLVMTWVCCTALILGAQIPRTRLIVWAVLLCTMAAISCRLQLGARGSSVDPSGYASWLSGIYFLLVGILPALDSTVAVEDPGRVVMVTWLILATASASLNVLLYGGGERRVWLAIGLVAGPYLVAFLIGRQWAVAGLSLAWVASLSAAFLRRRRGLATIFGPARAMVHPLLDSLTLVLNRDAFVGTLRSHQADGGQWIVGVIDLDRFKLVNDAFGHAAGDTVLRVSARRIVSVLPPESSVGRLGGDEFAVLVPWPGDQGRAMAIFDAVVDALNEPIQIASRSVRVHASVGLARMLATGDPSQSMINADVSMYRSKRSVESTVTFFDESLRRETSERVELEQALEAALDTDAIFFEAQPIFTVPDGYPVGAELLVRWRRDGSVVSPSEFIPVAEETGQVFQIGRRSLAAASELLESWQDDPELRQFGINVNLSPRHLEVGLLSDVLNIVSSEVLDRLGLEFVESELFAESTENDEQLRALAGLGVRIALDDFGTGYSSLTKLRTMPVTTVKVDLSFVAGIDTNAVNQRLLWAVAEMCEALGLRTVAEGVETDAELRHVAALGIPLVQGRLLGDSMGLDELTLLLRSYARLADEQQGPPTGHFDRFAELAARRWEVLGLAT